MTVPVAGPIARLGDVTEDGSELASLTIRKRPADVLVWDIRGERHRVIGWLNSVTMDASGIVSARGRIYDEAAFAEGSEVGVAIELSDTEIVAYQDERGATYTHDEVMRIVDDHEGVEPWSRLVSVMRGSLDRVVVTDHPTWGAYLTRVEEP